MLVRRSSAHHLCAAAALDRFRYQPSPSSQRRCINAHRSRSGTCNSASLSRPFSPAALGGSGNMSGAAHIIVPYTELEAGLAK
jgi:hypothetical protein